MRVERSSLEEVQAKFEEHKRKREEAAPVQPSAFAPRADARRAAARADLARVAAAGFETRVGWAEAEEEEQRRLRRERKLQKKARARSRSAARAVLSRASHAHAASLHAQKEEREKGAAGGAWAGDEGGLDPEMAAMMGFSGFAGK